MNYEIERKFLVNYLPQEIFTFPSFIIEQGYLAVECGGNEVRIRSFDGSYFLTIKSTGEEKRIEVEIEISKSKYLSLWELTQGRRIKKKRYLYNQFEVDVFEENLKGLIIVEIEFKDQKSSKQFIKPNWHKP